MRVLFAPDYRRAVPYQQLLADALAQEGVEVEFLSGYRRSLPLARAVRDFNGDLLHLHWPEEYYLAKNPVWSLGRKLRYPFDLALAARHIPMVVTAHDLRPHNRGREFLVGKCADRTLRQADAVFAHSRAAANILAANHGVAEERITVIAHGDLSQATGSPVTRSEARRRLRLGGGPCCLMAGTIEPYKGIEPVIEYWRNQHPAATLAVVGKTISPAYQQKIQALAADASNIRLHFGFQPEDQFRLWLSAVDCLIFNYASIFTSGAAALARSWGIPVLVPHRLVSLDLGEPDPRVMRFDTMEDGFSEALEKALDVEAKWEAGADWRATTRWEEVARRTSETYRKVIR